MFLVIVKKIEWVLIPCSDHFNHINDSLDNPDVKCTRPLFGYTKDSEISHIRALRTTENLQKQWLQTQAQLHAIHAVELEFATIPLYLTSLS